MMRSTIYAIIGVAAFFLFLFVAGNIFIAQGQSGTVVVQTTIVATAGSDPATAVTCTITPMPDLKGADMTCRIGAAIVQTASITPPVGAGAGVQGSCVQGTNNVTWLLTRPTATGTASWQVVANGIGKSGAF